MTSPFPFPLSPSSLPSPLSSLLPSIAQQTSGLGLTPSTNPFLALERQYPSNAGNANGSIHGGGQSVKSVRGEEITLEDSLRGLEESGRLITRAQGVLGEIERLEGRYGGVGLELLQLEYNQLINSIYQLAITTSFGALPLSLSSSSSSSPSPSATDTVGGNVDVNMDATNTKPTENNSNNTPESSGMSTAELTTWCENRAALEFSRREGVKGAGKVVLDILRGGK